MFRNIVVIHSVTSLFFLFLLFCWATPSQSSSTFNFLHLSDFHYDPLYVAGSDSENFCRQSTKCSYYSFPPPPAKANTAFGEYGCDAPLALVNELLRKITTVEPDPDFILVTGDSAGHCLDETATLDSISTVFSSIRQYFPSAPVYPVIGNNDVYPANTLPIGPSSFLSTLAQRFSFFLSADQLVTFSYGGYYSASPLPGVRVLVLNTLFYYTKWSADNSDPAGQLKWLTTQLQAAQTNSEKVFLVGHIAPGSSRSINPDWEDEWVTAFLDVLYDYRTILAGAFFGHIHRDKFELLFQEGYVPSKKNQPEQFITPLFLAPSVTARDASDPSFRIVSYNNDTMLPIDYVQYALNLTRLVIDGSSLEDAWQFVYSFNEQYQMPPTPSNLMLLYNSFSDETNPVAFNFYYQNMQSALGLIDGNSKSDELCAMTELLSNELKKCT